MAFKTDKGLRIRFLQGFASFVSDHRLLVDTSGNVDDPYTRARAGDGSGAEHVSFGAAVIATGAPPFIPAIKGAAQGLETGGVHTSDSIWELPQVPASMAVIGGGAIGLEMAQMFRDFGSDVTVLEAQARLLPEVDEEIAEQLTQILKQESRLEILTQVQVNEIAGKQGDMQIRYSNSAGKQVTLRLELVLIATGKRPVLGPLNLQNAGVEIDGHMIKTDRRGLTSAPHIFAVGDVVGGLMLAHTAGQQGRVAAANILGEEQKYSQDRDCGVIFTRPQAAFAGVSIEQAKRKGKDAVEVKVPFSIDAKAMMTDETDGFIKLVVDKQTRKIIGVHMLADHADTLIGEAVMMVSAELTLEQVAQAIHPHPTQTELFGDLARRLLARLRRSKKLAKTH